MIQNHKYPRGPQIGRAIICGFRRHFRPVSAAMSPSLVHVAQAQGAGAPQHSTALLMLLHCEANAKHSSLKPCRIPLNTLSASSLSRRPISAEARDRHTRIFRHASAPSVGSHPSRIPHQVCTLLAFLTPHRNMNAVMYRVLCS
jgi:hypothetical protein